MVNRPQNFNLSLTHHQELGGSESGFSTHDTGDDLQNAADAAVPLCDSAVPLGLCQARFILQPALEIPTTAGIIKLKRVAPFRWRRCRRF